MTRALEMLQLLAASLQTIQIANGFATNAGRSVITGPVPQQAGEAFPFCRLHEVDASVESPLPHRPSGKVRVQFIAEATTEQSDARQIMASGHELIGDLKKGTVRRFDARPVRGCH